MAGCCSCDCLDDFKDEPMPFPTDEDNFPQVLTRPHDLRDATAEMKKGVPFKKFNARGEQEQRFLHLDRDQTRLWYFPSKKDLQDTQIFLRDIVAVKDSADGSLPDTLTFKSAKRIRGSLQGVSCFSIVYRVRSEEQKWRYKTLDLGFTARPIPSKEVANEEETPEDEDKDDLDPAERTKLRYRDAIVFLAQRAQKADAVDAEQMELLNLWMEADVDNDRKLTMGEINKLLRSMQIELDRESLQIRFDKVDVDHSGYLSFDEFEVFHKGITERPEIDKIFNHFASGQLRGGGDFSKMMSPKDFAHFMSHCQTDQISEDDGLRIIRKVTNEKFRKDITCSQFSRFLYSTQMNSWWKPHQLQRVHQSMKHPLSHYYINTSHNTFLTGDQIQSRSSAAPYSKCLHSGVRCVEIHVHEGLDDDGLYVFHGHGLKVKVEEVCQSIIRNAFKKNPWPVILTTHLYTRDPKQHQILARLFKDYFGERLVLRKSASTDAGAAAAEEPGSPEGGTPGVQASDLEETDDFTPETLQGKILVMCRTAYNKTLYNHSVEGEATDDEKSDRENEAPDEGLKGGGRKQQHWEVEESVSQLVFLRSTRLRKRTLGEFASRRGDWVQARKKHEVVSFKETWFKRVRRHTEHRNQPGAMINLSRKAMCRVYPDPERVHSDNFLPTPYWAEGVSLVSLNQQQPDYPLRLNAARFQANGGCGYLLKPEYLREGDSTGAIDHPYNYKFRVNIVSGNQIPAPKSGGRNEVVDPYVALWIHGCPQDTSEPRRTATEMNNGFKPVWEEVFEFNIRALELAMLTLRVYHYNPKEKDEAVCEASIPLTALRMGYRTVPLFLLGGSHHNVLSKHARLLCHFSLTEVEDDEELR